MAAASSKELGTGVLQRVGGDLGGGNLDSERRHDRGGGGGVRSCAAEEFEPYRCHPLAGALDGAHALEVSTAALGPGGDREELQQVGGDRGGGAGEAMRVA
jgi:hypothetical protein